MLAKIAIAIVKLYQKIFSFKQPSCRFYPTCSQYSIMAFEKYGFFKGLLKTVWRILRCNPYSKGGVDYP
ncbi:MAG: membrane protein insertion efficiency factor YidD [Hydrogenothermaceae bacterium]